LISLPEIGHLLQSALITWIIWETIHGFVGRWIKPEYQLGPVSLIALGVTLTPWPIPRAVFTVVALVALLHYFLSKTSRR
jgi:hypothetical protein